MRRFDFDDNEEYREEVDNLFGEMEEGASCLTPEEYKAIVEEERAMQQIQVGLAQRDMNQRLLARTIKTLEKSFFWRFYSLNTRLQMIERTFRRLRRLE